MKLEFYTVDDILHGFSYCIAPDAQIHVASVLWLGKNFPIDRENLRKNASHEFTQDNLFSTLLGFFDVQTEVYEKNMDILKFSIDETLEFFL